VVYPQALRWPSHPAVGLFYPVLFYTKFPGAAFCILRKASAYKTHKTAAAKKAAPQKAGKIPLPFVPAGPICLFRRLPFARVPAQCLGVRVLFVLAKSCAKPQKLPWPHFAFCKAARPCRQKAGFLPLVYLVFCPCFAGQFLCFAAFLPAKSRQRRFLKHILA
jgi:hypothetical protein